MPHRAADPTATHAARGSGARHLPRRAVALALSLATCLAVASPSAASALAFRRNGGENHVFIEAGGSGLVGSLNYEYRYAGFVTFRVGFMPGLSDYLEQTYTAVPITVGILSGTEAHMFDASAGVTVMPTNVTTAQATLNLGYRYISTEGYVFRVFYTHLYDLETGESDPWGGLSAGLCF